MAVLQCEICGGKLIGKPGGVFECDSCGMEYSTEWAKAKVQEIKGTVKIEGPVEVTGTVKVEHGASVENLLKRGWAVLSDGHCKESEKIFKQVLEIDAECAEAYLGLTMNGHGISVLMRADIVDEDDGLVSLEEDYIEDPRSYDNDKNFRRALKFADPELLSTLNAIKYARKDFEKQEAQRRQRMIPEYAKRREQLSQIANMISAGNEHIAVVKSNGTVVIVNCAGQKSATIDMSFIRPGWQNMIAVSCGNYCTVGLRANGTVSVIGTISSPTANNDMQTHINDWKDIVSVSAGETHIVGVTVDKTVISAGKNEYGQCNVQDWSDIIMVSAGCRHTIGLKSDGSVVATGDNEWGQCNTEGWSDVVMVGAGDYYTVALKSNGTVVMTGDVYYDSLVHSDILAWSDIVTISSGKSHVVGLKSDGTVKIAGSDAFGQHSLRGWDDIVAIAAGGKLTAVLRIDGSVWHTEITQYSLRGERGDNFARDLKVFKDFATITESIEKSKHLLSQYADIQTELTHTKGLFSGSKRKELETRLAQIKKELDTL